jgi:hypothetical protein
MTRIIAKLVAVFFVTLLHIAPLFAAPVTYIANGGSGTSCTSAAPCGSLSNATAVDNGGQITCLDPNTTAEISILFSGSVTIDCLGLNLVGPGGQVGLVLDGTNQVVKIRNLTMSGVTGGLSAISFTGSGTLILENCVFENFTGGPAIEIEPTGAFNLVITNSRISNSAAGMLIQPSSGGSVNATFDRVTVTQNSGGGIKINTASGPVTVDMTASVITDNTGNGLNAVSGAAGAAMISIGHSVISQNGAAGVQANGANAAALIDTTLLDSNGAGALEAIGSGRILTYGNNRIVGSAGTGFTGPAPLQ